MSDYTAEEIASASLEEILEFDNMPDKCLQEITAEMNFEFNEYFNMLNNIRKDAEKIRSVILNAKQQGAINIQDKAETLLSENLWEEKKITAGRRVFYKRLKALDLIEE
jgi:hypothetical protein